MKTLERFWQWHDAEKPEPVAALLALAKNVSQSALDTLSDAASYIAARAGKPYALSFALEQHPGALRDLSLALCRALDAMDEAVPEGEAKARFLTTVDPALAHDCAERERGFFRDQYAGTFESFDPCFEPPKHVRSRCVRSLEAQAEDAECTRLLGPATCSECQSTPCRWSRGGWPDPVFRPDSAESARRPPLLRDMSVNPDLNLDGCNALRGSSGVLVRLAGKAADYNQAVLRYLLIDVLDPGHIATTYADPEIGRRWEAWKAERVDVEIRNSAEAARRP